MYIRCFSLKVFTRCCRQFDFAQRKVYKNKTVDSKQFWRLHYEYERQMKLEIQTIICSLKQASDLYNFHQ